MPTPDDKYAQLLDLIGALTKRVYRLEQQAGLPYADSHQPSIEAPAQPILESDLMPAAPPTAPPHTQDELESRIGGYWLNRAGVVAVLIGVSYFLKYAFDSAWVGPATRVVIGLLGGMGIVFWSEHVRKRGYAVYSFSLKGLGIGILYLSLWASSQVYGLAPAGVVFLATVVVTAATAGMALIQNSQIIAGFAAVGAFLTPIVLSSGDNRPWSLFAYMMLLDAGVLLLVHYRAWFRLLVGSALGSLVLFSLWYAENYDPSQFWVATLGISVFFILFASIPALLREGHDSVAVAAVSVANVGIYFLWIHALMDGIGMPRWAAAVAVVLGVAYFCFAGILMTRSPGLGANIHKAIGVSLWVVAVPIGLEARWITIGWLLEGGALLWASLRSENRPIQYLGGVTLALGVSRLVLHDRFDVHRLIFNERMLTFGIAIAVLALVARQVHSRRGETGSLALPILIISINALALIVLDYEIADAWRRQLEGASPAAIGALRVVRDFAYSALWMVYGAALMFLGFWKTSRFLRWQALLLIAVTIGKVFLYDTLSLDRGYRILSLIALGCILLATSFVYQRDWFKLRQRQPLA